MPKKDYRKSVNRFYLTETLEDMLYSSLIFTVKEEFGEVIKYKKTKIKYQSLHSTTEQNWNSPDIDIINLVELVTDAKCLFGRLIV